MAVMATLGCTVFGMALALRGMDEVPLSALPLLPLRKLVYSRVYVCFPY